MGTEHAKGLQLHNMKIRTHNLSTQNSVNTKSLFNIVFCGNGHNILFNIVKKNISNCRLKFHVMNLIMGPLQN